MAKRLCIIIVNYKTPELTVDCIDSLCSQLDPEKDAVIIVDNCSGDDSVGIMEREMKNKGLSSFVSIIPAMHNNGFSYGNNIGIKAMDAEFYLLANSDTVFRRDSVRELLNAAELYPSAIIGPRLEFPDGEAQVSCFRFNTPVSELINSAETGKITNCLKKYNVPLPVSSEVIRPEWISFACVLIPKAIVNRVGLMDEGYFMYYEDIDFCQRTRRAGFDIIYWPASHVVHLQGKSSDVNETISQEKRLPLFYYKSRSRYYIKFFGKKGLLLANLLWVSGRIISLCKETLLARRKKSACSFQFIDIWKK
jgi:GT2 family glycosyltransferase